MLHDDNNFPGSLTVIGEVFNRFLLEDFLRLALKLTSRILGI